MNVHLDYNAGAPLRPAAAAGMATVIEHLRRGGNPSSPHAHGRLLRRYVDEAREQVAALVDAELEEVVFTSGASEAASTVLAVDWDEVLCTDLEHDCVIDAIRAERHVLPVTADGVLELAALQERLAATAGDGRRRLVAVMAASNETGVVQPVAAAVTAAQAAGAAVLCDAAQIIGRVPFSFRELGVDYAVVSSEKIGGPPGVGAILARGDGRLTPLIRGGGQEGYRRAGTENVVGLAGFAAAATAAAVAEWAEVRRLRDWWEESCTAAIPGVRFFGTGADRLPNTSCLVVPGWTAESLVIALDLDGFSVGAGSACSSGKAKPGRALVAMGFGAELARAALRVSLGPATERAELAALIETLQNLVAQRAPLAA